MVQIDKVANNSLVKVLMSDFAHEYYTFHKKGTKDYFSAAKLNLQTLTASPKPHYTSIHLDFLQSILVDFEEIIKSTPLSLDVFATKYTTGKYQDLLYKNKNQEPFGAEIQEAFDYSAFRSSAKASWFCEKLDIKACLYCNAQFALAIGKNGNTKKLLFQLDHFYNKSAYPYLSLTMGNLVPSCSICNNSKSNTHFTIKSHIHPYLESANSLFKFKVDEANLLKYYMGARDRDLLKPSLEIIDTRFDSHQTVFDIESIYHKHTDLIEELLLKRIYYNKSRVDEIRKYLSKLSFPDSTIDRFVLGNYSLESEINSRPLSKLSRDISKQLEKIKIP